MIWLPIAVGAVSGVYFGNRFASQGGTWCYSNICWLYDKSPECDEELRRIRVLAKSGSRAYRLQPQTTVASFLNRSFIRSAYQGRAFYVERMDVKKNKASVFISFAEGTHMAFELERPCIDCTRDIWVVKRYAYLDENPLGCCR